MLGLAATRNMSRRISARLIWMIVAGVSLGMPVFAESVPFPVQLYGKSVVVRWENVRLNRFEGSDTVVHADFKSELTVYVSDKGRAFTKYRAIGRGNRSGEAVQSPVDSSNSFGGSFVLHFEKGDLMVDTKLMSGARRVAITFARDYASCGATVIFGKEAGQPMRARDNISGRKFEVISDKHTTPTCSMISGNVFAQP